MAFDGSTLIDYTLYLNVLSLSQNEREKSAIVTTNITKETSTNYSTSKSFITPKTNAEDIADSESKKMYVNECTMLMNDSLLHFMDKDERKQKFRFKWPTWLLSYGGSGNTLTRVIREYITSIWSGSISGDGALVQMGDVSFVMFVVTFANLSPSF